MTPSSSASFLDYDRLRDSLADSGAVVALAELHGGICGALCAGGAATAQRWLAQCLADDLPAATTAAIADDLEELIAASERMLADDELKFEPLLPDDDAPLDEQVQALALWCQGFLGGVGAAAPRLAQPGAASEALAEILRDFAEISRAGLSEDEAAGENQPDFALAEIHEYVRVSVAVVFEELGAERAAGARGVH